MLFDWTINVRVQQPEPLVPVLGDRSLFPELEATAYLAHAAISPVSVAVRRATHALLSDYEHRGLAAFLRWDRDRQALRRGIAELIGGEPEEIALVCGTTRGISDLALSMAWNPGDRVILFRGEFPAMVTPWQRAAELFNLELVWLDADQFRTDEPSALAALTHALIRGARLVAVSAVQFQTGYRMPMEAIGKLCNQHGSELAVDAIQACGAVPVDVKAWQADYLICGAHKFLMGLEGAGFLWIRGALSRALIPRTAGWLSHQEGTEFLFQGPGKLRYDRPFKQDPSVFEGSTLNAVGLAALRASLDLINTLGAAAIHTHINSYLDTLEPELEKRGFTSLRSPETARRSAILSFEAPPGINIVELHHAVFASGIVCSLPDGKLRFAPHWPNHRSEIPHVIASLDRALAEQGFP